MPKQVTAFEAADGSLHANACAAATLDIKLLVEQSPIADNKPYARRVIEWLCSDAENIAGVLMAFDESCPNGPMEPAPLETQEGPVVNLECSAAPMPETDMHHAE